MAQPLADNLRVLVRSKQEGRFVEGLKPFLSDDEVDAIGYEVRPGVFKHICARAEAAWQAHGEKAPKYLLVIDEINRANRSKRES